jgi:hypothetical protein
MSAVPQNIAERSAIAQNRSKIEKMAMTRWRFTRSKPYAYQHH